MIPETHLNSWRCWRVTVLVGDRDGDLDGDLEYGEADLAGELLSVLTMPPPQSIRLASPGPGVTRGTVTGREL